MANHEITPQSVEPVDPGNPGAAGFENLLQGQGTDGDMNRVQDQEGRIRVRHGDTDENRALGASERIVSEFGIGVWTVEVTEVAAT
jgi:hypothetical protein